MAWFGNFWRWLWNQKTDEEILREIRQVIERELSKAAEIQRAIQSLEENWPNLSPEQRVTNWGNIHRQIMNYEVNERVMDALELQLTRAERKSVFAKAKQLAGQVE
ncbi:MAG TPA: hypothetical protein VJJ82_06010 [Candidatus Nanoarchaeia archaeon]|nr:hypothetical protein [Candidatus Nanoarchaeia archaeon]